MATDYFNQLFSPLPQQEPSAQLPSMQPINNALAANAMKPAPVAPPQHHGLLSEGSPVRNFLGMVGDALLVANGGQPIYHQRQQQQQMQSALQNFLGDPQGSIAALMRVDPASGIDLYKATHQHSEEPDAVRELRAAGIDPSSQEGKAALTAHLGKAPIAGIAEYQYYQQNGGTLPFADFLRIIHPPGGGSFEDDGGAPAPSGGPVPFVSSPAEAAKYPPGTLVNTPYGQYHVPGGATGSAPSRGFR